MSEEKPVLTGIVQVIGEHDTGKTTFCLEAGAHPNRTLFVDDDVKGRATVQELRAGGYPFGDYWDLVELKRGRTEIEFFDAVLDKIQSIEAGSLDLIIWDTWAGFQSTFKSVIETRPQEFRQKWSARGDIKGAQQWNEAEKLEAAVLHRLQLLAGTVLVASHTKPAYIENKAVPGKTIPASDKAIRRVSRMRLWLRHNPSSPVPVALVLKRLDQKIYVPDVGIRTVSVLPRKLTPADTDRSLWDTIKRYIQDPISDRELRPEEIPTAHEISILENTLTPDQRDMFTLMLKAGAFSGGEMEDEDLFGKEEINGERVKELRTQGLTPAAIAETLTQELGREIIVSDIVSYLR